MALQHSNTADAWTPADYGQLVNLAVQSKPVAFKAATVFRPENSGRRSDWSGSKEDVD